MKRLEEREVENQHQANIPSNYSRLIARTLELNIQRLPLLLEKTGLSKDQFLLETTLLTPDQQIQILQNALQLSSDDAFGLLLGHQLNPLTHGSMGLLVNSSSDLLSALDAFKTFIPTRMSFARVKLETKGAWLECDFNFDVQLDEMLHRCASEVAIIVLFEFAKFILGRPLREAVISFSHEQPNYHLRYADYLPCPIEFSAARVMVKIPLSLCKEPNVSADHNNYILALRQCELMLAQLKSKKDNLKYQIQKMMLSQSPSSLSENEAAATLFVSKRTSSRKLRDEDTSFRQIREEILSQQAANYLCETKLSVEAIAAQLNYHDSANFRRAFKRWYKMTPDQYRQDHRK